MNYYNEHDPKAAAWLRVLISENLITKGEVDERDIQDIRATELDGYSQCHFFAGIGGWSLALRLAGWPDDKPVWTGSCPCQPFSCAGQGLGADDERHLWPDFRNLIGQCRPSIVFGEQVASKDGRGWLAGVRTDLENAGYAFGSADLCAAGVGSPQKRQRFFWVANPKMPDGRAQFQPRESSTDGRGRFAGNSTVDALDDADERKNKPADTRGLHAKPCSSSRLVQSDGAGRDERRVASPANGHGSPAEPTSSQLDTLGDSKCNRGSSGLPEPAQRQEGHTGKLDHAGGSFRFWDASRIIHTSDGKARRIPVEPVFQRMADGISNRMDILRNCGLSDDEAAQIQAAAGGFPLAQKTPGRVMLLKGYGNAIVPALAAEFIRASFEDKL